MSWLRRQHPYADFSAQAQLIPTVQPESTWRLEILEVTQDAPTGRRFHASNPMEVDLSKATLRIIFAPLDIPRRDALAQMTTLFRHLDIPEEFTTERTLGACHSFGKRATDFGFISWFHFLCKNIEIIPTASGGVSVRNRAAELKYMDPSDLSEADYSWNRSGFFLRSGKDSGPILVCFGATNNVRRSLEEFIAAHAWEDVEQHPFLLFDLVLQGLCFQVEGTIRNMTSIFSSHEHRNLSLLNTAVRRKLGSRNPFTGLHNCAKHVIHLAEAVESCLLLTQSTISASRHIEQGSAQSIAANQLQESLQYRLSLFHSTQLKLASLQKRIDNAINLSFNIVTQQDSLLMIQDSTTMRVIAAITMIFLPTTGVATVAGSQLLFTTRDEGRWEVIATPMFWLTWWIAIPLTVLVIAFAWLWHLWARGLIQGLMRKGTKGSCGEKG